MFLSPKLEQRSRLHVQVVRTATMARHDKVCLISERRKMEGRQGVELVQFTFIRSLKICVGQQPSRAKFGEVVMHGTIADADVSTNAICGSRSVL